MDGLPFQLPIQVGTELFPNIIEAPPVMTTEIEEPQELQDDRIDPRQGSETNTYGMEDGQSPKSPGDNVPPDTGPEGGKQLRAEAMWAAEKMIESAQGQIRGWFMGQKHNAELSALGVTKKTGVFPWGRMIYAKAAQTQMLELKVSAAAINHALAAAHNAQAHDLFNHLLAVQFDDGGV